MDCRTPAFPMLHYFPEFAQTHSLSQRCYLIISSSAALFSSCLQPFPASRSFPMSQFFSSDGSSSHQLQSIGASSASTSVLPCFQGLISKGLSSIFQHHSSKTSVLRCSFPYGPTHICGEIIIEIKKMISAKFRLPLVGKERAGPWWSWRVCHRAWFIVSSVKWKIRECSFTIILKPSLYVICTLVYKYPLEFEGIAPWSSTIWCDWDVNLVLIPWKQCVFGSF